MGKIQIGRITAALFFLALLMGAVFSLQRLGEDISAGKYFLRPEELRYETVFLSAHLLIIIFLLRYGYYLAVNRVQWKTVKDDFLFLLNKKYFSPLQWLINVLLFWFSLFGFIYALAISTMKGQI